MATITFDTLKFVKRLESVEAELVSKKDFQLGLAPIQADLTLVKWMLGILLGGVVALILKAFFLL